MTTDLYNSLIGSLGCYAMEYVSLSKHRWPWSDAAFCGVSSGSTLFASVAVQEPSQVFFFFHFTHPFNTALWRHMRNRTAINYRYLVTWSAIVTWTIAGGKLLKLCEEKKKKKNPALMGFEPGPLGWKSSALTTEPKSLVRFDPGLLGWKSCALTTEPKSRRPTVSLTQLWEIGYNPISYV